MLKILYLATDFFLKGGIQRYSRAQVQALRELFGEENITTMSVHASGENAYEKHFYADYIGDGTSTISRIRYVLSALHSALYENYDVVFANHISLLPVAILLSKVCRIKHTIGNVYGLEMWSGLHVYERWALGQANRIISDCHYTAEYVMSKFGLNQENIHVIWDPVDIDRFRPLEVNSRMILQRYGISYTQDKTCLMTLGRISVGSRHKGYDRMLDVMKQIDRNDVVYVIVGDGNDRFRLEERVAKEGLRERVFFLGSVQEDDLVTIYNLADIFVLVSDSAKGRGEGVPLTPLEAASCGKPIIVGNEDGSPESVQDGVNGYVVSPRDLITLKERILKLVRDPEKRKKMGINAREHIRNKFSYQSFRNKTEILLQKLHSIK